MPIFLELTALGLAVGDPLFPAWLEVGLIGAIGIIPVLVMQWFRPFDIFSILVVSLKHEHLTPNQRRLLSCFRRQDIQGVAIAGAVFLIWVLGKIYQASPAMATAASFLPQWRLLGLMIASLSFLASNLFFQIPLSVIRVLLLKDSTFAATEPYPVTQISQDFTIPGIGVNRILPLAVEDKNPKS